MSDEHVPTREIVDFDDQGNPRPGPANYAAAGPLAVPCKTCKGEYDPADPDAVRHHAEPARGCGCNRCDGKPRCYFCGSSFCFCTSH